MRVGLPRALLFHQYGDCWTSFLETLGVEPVVTAATTNDTVVRGTVHADNETCLPVKVFAGHLLDLKENTDAILVPRVVSQHRGMKACPKYLGLPDMARSFDLSLPPVLAPVMDLGDRRSRWARDWYELAGDLGANRDRASAAVKNMLDRLRYAERVKEVAPAFHPPREIKVGVAGHLYNVYDPRASLGLLERIRAMGAKAVTVEEVPRRQARRQLKTLPRKIRWDFENRMVGSILHWSRTASVSGVIYVSSFACGPGSMIGALIEDELGRERSVPLMSIILDEHSAEGGLITRIEAFLDMLKWVSRDARSGENAAGRTQRRW